MENSLKKQKQFYTTIISFKNKALKHKIRLKLKVGKTLTEERKIINRTLRNYWEQILQVRKLKEIILQKKKKEKKKMKKLLRRT